MKLMRLLAAIFIGLGLIPGRDSFALPSDSVDIVVDPPNESLPLLKARRAKISYFLKAPIPILEPDTLLPWQEAALRSAEKDERFIAHLRDKNKQPYLNEVFGIYPVKPGDYNGALVHPSDTAKIEMYNFGLNLATVAIVDAKSGQVLQVSEYPDAQPDISPELKDLALELATNSKRVIAALGGKPEEESALMASTKTALNHTRCERSRHLCVAPTFVKDDKALWAIVDLTELNLAGIRWTNTGTTGPPLVTEKLIQNEYITANFCDQTQTLDREEWKMSYHLTSSDGLEIKDVSFKDSKVLDSVKLVDWHVRYSNTEGFGYSDAIGCPVFSQAAVVANQPPKVSEIPGGFALEQTYFNQDWPTPCNYNYVQRYEFYKDGRFRISTASIGRGCGNDGTYTPVFRIAFANTKGLSEFTKSGWKAWDKEGWVQQTPETEYSPEGYQFRVDTGEGRYFLEPSRGQFTDGGRGDFAYTYVTVRKPDEGEGNLITIGPCCNIDYHQGPEKFIEPHAEELGGKPLILWYTPQMKNDDRVGQEYCWAESVLVNGTYTAKTFPCFAGPMFVPHG